MSTQLGEDWQYVRNPHEFVRETNGLLDKDIEGTSRTMESVAEADKTLSEIRSDEIKMTAPEGAAQWSEY